MPSVPVNLDYVTRVLSSIPAAIITAKNGLWTPNAFIVTLEVPLDDDVTARLCDNTEDILLDGHLYAALPFSVGFPAETSDGAIPSWTITIDNISRALEYVVEKNDGFVDRECTLSICMTVAPGMSLPAGASPYSRRHALGSKEFTTVLTVLNARKTSTEITWSLGIPNPYFDRFPPEPYLKRSCIWAYRGAECAYTGDIPSCGKTFADCTARSNLLRYGGKPNLGDATQ